MLVFSKAVRPNGKVSIVGRLNREDGLKLTKKLNASEWLFWNEIDKQLSNVDILINCTSLGFGDKISESPLNYNQLRKLKTTCVVYDIIYQPFLTKLLEHSKKLNLEILNGSEMNLEQAVLAYGYAISKKKIANLFVSQ